MRVVFRKPKNVPDHARYDYVVFYGSEIVGFVRKKEEYANIRPRPVHWTSWVAYDENHKRLEPYQRRIDAANALVRAKHGKVVPTPKLDKGR